MRKKIRLTIGEFSRFCQVTVKTLRHYGKLGLLVPSEVDEWTGYRYYDVSQMQRLNAIRHLKDMGFALDEIKTILDDENRTPDLNRIQEKISQCRRQMQLLQERHRLLTGLARSLKTRMTMKRITIQSLPAITVASYRTVIPSYNELGRLCYETIGPEMQRMGCRCVQPGYCFTVDHRDEYSPTDIDIEYCEQVEEALADSPAIKFKHLDAVPTAVCMNCYGPYERLCENYAELFSYIEQNGFRITARPRASYVDGAWNQDDPEKWLTVIQVPVERC